MTFLNAAKMLKIGQYLCSERFFFSRFDFQNRLGVKKLSRLIEIFFFIIECLRWFLIQWNHGFSNLPITRAKPCFPWICFTQLSTVILLTSFRIPDFSDQFSIFSVDSVCRISDILRYLTFASAAAIVITHWLARKRQN